MRFLISKSHDWWLIIDPRQGLSTVSLCRKFAGLEHPHVIDAKWHLQVKPLIRCEDMKSSNTWNIHIYYITYPVRFDIFCLQRCIGPDSQWPSPRLGAGACERHSACSQGTALCCFSRTLSCTNATGRGCFWKDDPFLASRLLLPQICLPWQNDPEWFRV